MYLVTMYTCGLAGVRRARGAAAARRGARGAGPAPRAGPAPCARTPAGGGSLGGWDTHCMGLSKIKNPDFLIRNFWNKSGARTSRVCSMLN